VNDRRDLLGFVLQRRMRVRELRLGHLALHAFADERADRTERMERIAERLADRLEMLAGLLQSAQCDERAQHFVRALEDQIDARIAQRLLVRKLL